MNIWFIIIMVIVAIAMARSSDRARTFRRDVLLLREFAEEVSGGLRSARKRSLDGALLKGTLDGRAIALQFGACVPGQRYVLQFGVAVDPSVSLRIKDPTFLGRLFGESVRTGAGHVDERFFIKSQQAGKTRDMFVHGGQELYDLLADLLEQGQTDEIVAEGGWLYLQCELGSLNDAWFRWYFARMVKLARFYERRPILVRSRPRFAWTGGGEDALCPYCRDSLPEDLETAVGCDVCNTLHHDECFAEHGGCTIFGCEGRPRAVPVDA